MDRRDQVQLQLQLQPWRRIVHLRPLLVWIWILGACQAMQVESLTTMTRLTNVPSFPASCLPQTRSRSSAILPTTRTSRQFRTARFVLSTDRPVTVTLPSTKAKAKTTTTVTETTTTTASASASASTSTSTSQSTKARATDVVVENMPSSFSTTTMANNKLLVRGPAASVKPVAQVEESSPRPTIDVTPSRTFSITSSSTPQPIRPSTKKTNRFGAVAGSEQPPQSNRLAKARLLLEQLTSDDPDMVPSASSLLSISTSSPSSSKKKSNKSNNLRIVTNADDNEEDVSYDPLIVPDSYGRNGHLQESGRFGADQGVNGKYVTRWARGVKVAEPLVKYDPIVAERLLFRQPTKWLVRNWQIAVPLGLWAVGAVADVILSGNQLTSQQRRKRAQQLTRAISSLGPAIIKGGQALASRPDLMPAEYLEELQKLQDDVPRFSNERALQTVQDELGVPFDEVFELVQEEPVAAASIGQVYKARLKDNGDIVALKIQRPGCEEIIALDLYVLRWWCGLYNRIFLWLNRDIDLQAVIDDFGELIYREIDYVAEAANAQRFNELYAGVQDVFVPKIYSELTTSKVLTMEWVDGVRLTDRDSLKRFGLDESRLVNTLVQCSLKQILENGFFHADPHAGNLLAFPDGRLCYLDFGMMSYAATSQRNGFLLAVVHIVNRDWPALVRLYRTLGFIPEGTDLKPIEVALEKALPDVLNADITELNFKNVINKLGDIMYTFPFSLPPFYIAIIRCLGVLEGLAIQVDPKARIISKAYPYVASRVLTDPQPELQEALRRLALTSDGTIRWGRLESLLDEAKESSGYDVTAALDMLTNYLLSKENDKLLPELAEQIVSAGDALGADTVQYLVEASRALAIRDEVAAVRAFRSLQELFARRTEEGFDGVRKKMGDELRGVLPEPSPSMRRFMRIISLIGAKGDNNHHGSGTLSIVAGSQTDPAKFVPIVRKLVQDPRVQQTANEILARLWERALSRGLRAAFGLPPPMFGSASQSSTVTEDRE